MTTTTETLEAFASLEEMRLIDLADRAAQALADLTNRLPRGADERHDLLIDRAVAREASELRDRILALFWRMGSDLTLAEYVAQPQGQRESWLERNVK